MSKAMLVAVDVGGTFTDVAAYDPSTGRIRHAKSLTTYGDYIVAMDRCLKFIDTSLSDCISFKHGTTLVINMLIQRAGARIALVTTRGFKDVLEFGRGNRAEPFKAD
jgi:N-methylhydantoinase A